MITAQRLTTPEPYEPGPALESFTHTTHTILTDSWHFTGKGTERNHGTRPEDKRVKPRRSLRRKRLCSACCGRARTAGVGGVSERRDF